MDTATIESALATRAAEHHCELVVEQIGHGLWRASLKTLDHPTERDGAIRLSAAREDRERALRDLYDAGEPR